MECRYCRGTKGHYKGCPELSDGDSNMFMLGMTLGLDGSQDLESIAFRKRTNASFVLGFKEGRRKQGKRAERDESDLVQRAWEHASQKGAIIKALPGLKFVTKTDKGGYRYRLVYDDDAGEVVISGEDKGKMCFSKNAPDIDQWTCLIVRGTNPKGTVVFAEPSDREV